MKTKYPWCTFALNQNAPQITQKKISSYFRKGEANPNPYFAIFFSSTKGELFFKLQSISILTTLSQYVSFVVLLN